MDLIGVDWKPYKHEIQSDMFDDRYEVDIKEMV